MSFDPFEPPPLLTADLPGIGGRIKDRPEDFEVEEIPAYEPAGVGGFLYLWVEKRDMGAEYFARQVARRLGIGSGDVGTAGLKDRRAVTRQWVSVPDRVADRVELLQGDGIRVLESRRHSNKLRTGHLHGNRFSILVRDADPGALERLVPLIDRLRRDGVPNFFGPQRFGRGGDTATLGLSLLRPEGPAGSRRLSPFLRKLALSSAQAALFNAYLSRRITAGLFRRVLAGDVMMKWPVGGMFLAYDLPREQQRFDARETVHAGPMFGRKTFAAEAEAAEREAAVLADAQLPCDAFRAFGKLLQGTRRKNLVYADDLSAAPEAAGIRLRFTLPAGSYATVLLRELMKTPDGQAGGDD